MKEQNILMIMMEDCLNDELMMMMLLLCPVSDLQQVPVANGTAAPCGSAKVDVKLELAFEYLMSKDRLQWVTITSPQVRLLTLGWLDSLV